MMTNTDAPTDLGSIAYRKRGILGTNPCLNTSERNGKTSKTEIRPRQQPERKDGQLKRRSEYDP